MNYKYDYLVFICRCQPFHYGHQTVINRALELSEKILILVGSANSPRSWRDPFTYEERKNVIEQVYKTEKNRISVLPLEDFKYNDQAWISNVQRVVLDNLQGNSPNIHLHGFNNYRVGLIGCSKDHTSYYLKMFPQWGNESVEFVNPINATDIRNEYFGNQKEFFNYIPSGSKIIPNETLSFLREFACSSEFDNLLQEHEYITNYKKTWENSPYPPTFVTTDAVIVQSGHILLVKRKARPGKGLKALPGGFIQQNEKILDCMIRELREETGLKIPDPVIRGSIVRRKVYDDPNRSSRGRTITHAFLVKLEDRPDLPKVKGSDDAEKAFWVPLADLTPKDMFEDHYYIIQNLITEL